MIWLQLQNGDYINSNKVEVISLTAFKGADGKSIQRITAITGDGEGDEYHELSRYALPDLETLDHPVVQAQPGFYVIEVVPTDPGEICVFRYPVVAWRVGPDAARPVTIESLSRTARSCILCPDGQCIEPDSAISPNEAEWIALAHKEMEDQRRRQQEQAATA